MSAYKKLNKQDTYITTYNAHKKWEIKGSYLPMYGIKVYAVKNSLIDSLKQLYFPEYRNTQDTSRNLHTLLQAYDTYNQTTLTLSGSKQFTGEGVVISIPQELYGNNIHNDQSVKLEYTPTPSTEFNYVKLRYWEEGYTPTTPTEFNYVKLGYWEEGYTPFTETYAPIVDDGEGNLYFEGSTPRHYIGYINYSHGIIYISDNTYRNTPITKITFKSNQPVYTYNINCRIRDFEYNYTTNPTIYLKAIQKTYDNNGDMYEESGSVYLGEMQSNITGSTFSPYVTTVGLYNDANQLIAVGKVSRPLPKSLETETTIIIKLDI